MNTAKGARAARPDLRLIFGIEDVTLVTAKSLSSLRGRKHGRLL